MCGNDNTPHTHTHTHMRNMLERECQVYLLGRAMMKVDVENRGCKIFMYLTHNTAGGGIVFISTS